ncbi:zinc finger protein 271-like [Plectropomus leopardus]|uniref:zinc finger protein 271-like n=1 Tax=Plectropomus leopardus TaxID=160734 RepID=UPI001C4D010F|nr:zinc finger protein 271-like [Plectropomus leopardus]
MSGTQLLRLRVNERLSAAAEEIFGLVEKTIAEYRDEAVRSRREVIQLRQQIEQLTALKPQVLLFRADAQSVSGDIFPSQQPEQLPNEQEKHESPQVKQEQVDLCISAYMEADIFHDAEVKHSASEPTTNCEPLPPVPVSVTESVDDGRNEKDASHLSHPNQHMDQCVTSEMKEESSEDVRGKLTELDTTAQSDCRLFPAVSTITVTINDDEWNKSQSALTEQQQAQKDDKTCHFCGKRFNRDSDLIKHVEMVHMKTKAFKCSECDKEFACRSHLEAHLRIHTGEKPHKCPFCSKSFTQRSNLNVHLRVHTREKPYFCKSCNRRVAYSSHLKTCSIKELRGGKSFCCLVCGVEFPTASKMWLHKKIHKAGKI